ncbi:putative membrane protein [Amorphus suaedae]
MPSSPSTAPAPAGPAALAGAFAWLATVQLFAVQIVAQGHASNYTMRDDDISALGIPFCGPEIDTCSPLHALFNGGMILVGLLTIAGALLTWRAWPDTRLARAALVVLAGAGVGAILVGSATVATRPLVHAVGAVADFSFCGIGMVLMGLATWRRERGFAVFSVLCGLVVLATFGFYAGGIYLDLGRGGMERVAATSATLWFVVAGVRVFAHADPTANRRPAR